MSGNPKQTATGGQQMRYTSPYQSMQPSLPPRDYNQLTNQNYVQQQPNQAGNPGPGLRGIAQTGPPNQAPTPPNQDLKVQTVPQPSSMNLYQPQNSVRQTQPFNYRPQGPPSQNPRMANNQHRGQQQMFPGTPSPQFVQMPLPQNVYHLNPINFFGSTQQRQNFVQQPVALLQSHQYAYQYPPAALTQSPPAVTYQAYYQMPRAGGPPPQPTSTPSNLNQTQISTMSLPPPIMSQQTINKQQKRRPNAVPIIDPFTGVNKLEEMYEQDNSHPPSGESSARQTPQPANHNTNKEVQATFLKQVAQTILRNEESSSYDDDRHSSTEDHMEAPPVFHPPPQQAVLNTKYDIIVQTSNLKAHAKEFVLPSAKETPIVSANCDSEEVTLPNKPQKGRESPAKGRRRETKDHHRESTKDVHIPKEIPQTEHVPISKDVHQVEKQQISVVKEESTKMKEPNVSVNNSNHQVIKSADKESDKRKKESKSEKHNEIIVMERTNQSNPNSQLPEPEVTAPNAKSKQNASQKKESQKTNHKSIPQNVPPPQPSKSSSKTSKKNEINNKGASKEGTEMDVFDITADNANANIPPPSSTDTSDIINANTVPASNNAVTVVNSNQNIVDPNNKKNDNSDVMVNKPVTEAKPHQKIDVMNVFGGKMPKPSPFIPPPSASNSNRDETDKAALVNDKLIQAKNEVNVSKTANSDINENKPELPYKDGQWSPFNTEGDKRYDKDFLMAVRNLAVSKIKPPNLPEIVDLSLDGNRQRPPDNRYSMGRTDFTNPPFMSPYGGKNSSMKGPQSITKHPSLTGGKMSNKGGKSTNGANKISISLREEVKLHETENAWKPGRLLKSDAKSDEDRKTEELYKKVRGVLNKLTPQKFDTLLNQIKNLRVDNVGRLQGVIDLIFEKAVDEPNFSVAYAKMCRELSLMQVPAGPDKKDEVVNFRKLLINRCQEEFEKQSKDETSINEKKTEIDECADPEKKKDLEFELEDIYRRIRMRSVGNIRFIGELFKINMLTTNIMLTCLNILLTTKDEESLECLCKLLSTIGKELEESNNKVDLTKFFNIMQEIVDKKHTNCSSRIRFMLQDAIDLRKNKWIPRRQDLNPKTIDQIQKEADNEHLNQAINSVPNTPRRDDRMGGNINKGKAKQTDDGWTVTQRSTFTLNKDKLKMKAPSENEPLGGSALFQSWSKGSQLKPQSVHPSLTNTNKYSVLDNSGIMDTEKKISGAGRFKDSAYSSKGSSLERGNYSKQSYDNRAGSRSGSQHRMNDNPMHQAPQRISVQVPSVVSAVPAKPAPPPTPTYPQLSEESRGRYLKNCLEEYINDNCTFEECEADIRVTFPTSYMSRMVADGYLSVLEKFMTHRLKTGMLFAKLIKVGTLPLEEYCVGLEEILSQVEDLIIDIPTIWTCLAEILVPVICEEALPLNRLHKCCDLLIRNRVADKLLTPIFKLIVSDKGPNFLRDVWQLSELKLSDFMPVDAVEKFVKDNQLEFLLGGQTVQGSSNINYEQIEKKLLVFFNSNSSFDDIRNWITANVGERVKENQFIRTLATAIFKYSIVRTKLDPDRLNSQYKLFHNYVDNNQAYELQCLYALQSLVYQMEHPQGLLLSIFNKLSEDEIFPQESFIAWECSEDPAEQEGKGVALKLLTSFFTQLKENDNDDEEEEDCVSSTGSEEA